MNGDKTKQPVGDAMPDASIEVVSVERDASVEGPLLHRASALRDVAGRLVRPLGLVRMPASPVLLRQPSGNGWVVLPLEDDPQFRAGRMAIPAEARQHIAKIAEFGIEFDRILVAHELPGQVDSTQSSRAPEKLIPSAREDRVAATLRDGLLRLASGVRSVARGATEALADLDPALLGVVSASGHAKPGEMVLLVEIASWT